MKAPLILLSVSAVGAVIGLGICGQDHQSTAGLGLIVLLLSALGLAVGVVWWVISLFVGRKSS